MEQALTQMPELGPTPAKLRNGFRAAGQWPPVNDLVEHLRGQGKLKMNEAINTSNYLPPTAELAVPSQIRKRQRRAAALGVTPTKERAASRSAKRRKKASQGQEKARTSLRFDDSDSEEEAMGGLLADPKQAGLTALLSPKGRRQLRRTTLPGTLNTQKGLLITSDETLRLMEEHRRSKAEEKATKEAAAREKDNKEQQVRAVLIAGGYIQVKKTKTGRPCAVTVASMKVQQLLFLAPLNARRPSSPSTE